MKPYLALFRSNLQLTLRDRSVLFFNYLFPFLMFFAFTELFSAGTGTAVAYFVGTVLTMGILGNGLWGAGMRAVQEREANILRRFKVTPAGPLPILIAAMLAGWLLFLPVVVLLLALAHFQYGMPLPRNWVSLLIMVTLGVFAFRGIGLILASVTNTMQEAMIFIQLLYLPMLFLSGATVPAAMLPTWAQTLGEFLPAAPLVKGFQRICFQNESIWQSDNRSAAAALIVAMVVGLFLSVKLFRWEKEEKLPRRNKLWVAAVLGPFLLMGIHSAYTKEHLAQNEAFFRDLERAGTLLIRNVRIFTGEGPVIENGFVVVKDGRIVRIGSGPAPDAENLHADVVEGAGKTLLPGFIDVHVHLGGPAGISNSMDDYDTRKSMEHAAAALLYSGVTAARSTGDGLEASLELRKAIETGSKLGAQLFVCGPMFTAEAGHGTEFLQHLPPSMRDAVKAQLVRTPKTPEEAKKQVRELKAAGVDGIKAILESGWGEAMLYDRLDLLLVRSVAGEARALHLPLAVHTGDAEDVTDAVEIGATSVEHGSVRDDLPDRVLAKMANDGVYLDPTLSVIEAYARYYSGKTEALNNLLVQQTVPARILRTTREFLESGKGNDEDKAAIFTHALDQARENLMAAWNAKVPLAMGTDAGNPLVFHGPSLHHELKLWVDAGIPAADALEAVTRDAARLLRAKNIGVIHEGFDADLLMVDGNPLEDISATERISMVVFKGERVRRAELFSKK